MSIHYLKIALRNLWKYKKQTLISVFGLAVGFTCFALSMLWIVYEITFDNFHKNAEQMYVTYVRSFSDPNTYRRFAGYKQGTVLKEIFPEIVKTTPIVPSSDNASTITIEDVKYPALIIQTDTSFLRMFDVKILEGNRDFLFTDNNKIAITRDKSRRLFGGNEPPIGKTVTIDAEDFTICAIVSDMPKRSNYAFDIIQPVSWDKMYSLHTIIELFPEINLKSFENKLFEHNFESASSYNNMKIKPITKLRYTDPDIAREVKFQHIVIFAVSGLLVIFCALFNSLTFYANRIRMRQKELALRVVCGASQLSLLLMISIEFILGLLFAAALGVALTQLVHGQFVTLSEIRMDLSEIYGEALMYFAAVIIVSTAIFWLMLLILRRRNLNVSIRRTNENISRKISVVVQLVISIGFAFSAIVIMKQMHFLHHTDELGFSFHNRGSVTIEEKSANDEGVYSGLVNYLKQIPEITEIADVGSGVDLLNPNRSITYYAKSWDEKPSNAEDLMLIRLDISPKHHSFYDLQLSAGEMINDADPRSLIMINENAVKLFGWQDPVGKVIDNFIVKGVIKNVYNYAPTIEAKPTIYRNSQNRPMWMTNPGWDYFYVTRTVLFKYHEGTWETCKEKIEHLISREFADATEYTIYNSEEEYNKLLKSETNLIRLLTFVSAICVIVCVFGFVSLVSLSCEERRKEIAIRKINGATAGNIIAIFAKEYFLLLVIGAAIAFPAGFLIMKRWLEQYKLQTNIPAWIYVSIIFAMIFVIIICVGWRVYKSSKENPAEVVKSE